jgi:hypothetical protein
MEATHLFQGKACRAQGFCLLSVNVQMENPFSLMNPEFFMAGSC